MTPTADASGLDRIARLIQVAPVGIDDFSALRYLYAKSLIAQTAAAVSDEQVATLIRLIYSPYYSDLVMEEEVIGAWLDGELVGSAAWHPGREPTGVARIGPVFVRHPRFGIGSRLLGEVAGRASGSSRPGRQPRPCRSSSARAIRSPRVARRRLRRGICCR
jgi:hypothetical protein